MSSRDEETIASRLREGRHGYALRVVDVGLPSHLLHVDVECEGAPRFDEPFEPYLARAVPR